MNINGGEYQQFFKKLMQEYVAGSDKNFIFLAHTRSILNEQTMEYDVKVPIKGALANQGIESFFSHVVSTKKVKIKDLADYESPMLNISEEEQLVGYKHCFQTRLTKNTAGERIRSAIGMWDIKETYIDNNIGHVLQRLHEYYDED